ncbi:hypothetical protein KIPB_009215, partial [Kipferlia bialata]|eukprot:g9215.t1
MDMAPKSWYLSCRETQLGSGVNYLSVATLSHNTILAVSERGQVDRYTVDPTTLALTDVVQLVEPPADALDQPIVPTVVSGYNQTALVTSGMLVETHPNGVVDFMPSPLEVLLFYPDTGDVRRIERTDHAKWPEPRCGCSAVVVDETLAVVGGSTYKAHSGADLATSMRPLLDMWCLDVNKVDDTDTWRSVSLETMFADVFCSPKLRASCNTG